MEETSIVWSTESLFPDLHPTVVDTSHSRTLDASTCLRILLIPRSILFSVQPKSLRSLSSSFPFRRKPRRDFQRARSTFVTKFIHRMNHRPMNNLDANRFQLGFPFSTWIFSLGFVVTVLLQNIFESRGKTGLSTWGNRRGLPAGPRRLHSTVAPARSINHCETEKDVISYSCCLGRNIFRIEKDFLKLKIVTGRPRNHWFLTRKKKRRNDKYL